jgi:O-antigen/teichoic acid export membrane protein
VLHASEIALANLESQLERSPEKCKIAGNFPVRIRCSKRGATVIFEAIAAARMNTAQAHASEVSSASAETLDFQSIRGSVGEISRQSMLFFSSTLFALGCNYFFKLFVARELGARLIGWNALGMGIYSMAKLAGQMGLPGSAVRFVSAYRSTGDFERLRGFFWRGLAWALCGACVLASIIYMLRHWLAVYVFHEPALSSYLPFYALLVPIGIGSSFLGGTLRGLHKASRPAVITNFVSLPVVIALSTAGLLLGFSLLAYIVAQVVGELVTLILIAIELHKISKGWLKPGSHSLPKIDKRVRAFAMSFMGVGLIDFATNHADRLVIGYFLDAKQVGIYAVATSAGVLIPIVLQAVNSVFSPMISSLHAQEKQRLLAHLYQLLTKWTLALTLPLVFVLVVFAAPFLSLFGADFRNGWLVLIVIALAEVIDCGVGSVGLLLMMSGNEKRYIRTQAVLAPLILGVKLATIPWLGVMGAAIGSAFGIAASNLAYLWQVRRCLGMQPLNRGYIRLLGPTAMAALSVLSIRALALRVALPTAAAIVLALVSSYGTFLISAAYALDQQERSLALIAWERTRSVLHIAPRAA